MYLTPPQPIHRLVGLLLGTAVLVGCGDSDPGDPLQREEARAALKEGRELSRKRRAADAKAAFRHATEVDPTFGEAWLALGQVLVYESDVIVGTSATDLKVLSEAVTALRRASELLPESAGCAYWTGNALATQGEEDEAVVHLERAIELDPSHGLAYLRLAQLHSRRGEVERANEKFERALELRPEDPKAWLDYGVLLEGNDDLEGARRSYERAIEVDWTVPSPYAKLAVVLERSGDSEGAAAANAKYEEWSEFGRGLKADLDKARANPEDTRSMLGAAQAYLAARQPDRALTWIQLALDVNPSDSEAKDLQARAQDAMKERNP